MQLQSLVTAWQAIHRAVGHGAAMQGWFYALSAGRNYLLAHEEYSSTQVDSRLPTVHAPHGCESFQSVPEVQSLAHKPGGRPHGVIVGAGPVGLMLAIALKQIFGRHLLLHVIENRITPGGKPVPYERCWPINIPSEELAKLGGLSLTVNRSANGAYVPWTLNQLETHLLSHARLTGAELIYSNEKTESLLSRLQPDLVFDATGGRWRGKGGLVSSHPLTLAPSDLQAMHGYSAFGVKPAAIAPCDASRLKVSIFESGLCQPTLNEVPLSCWMLKVRGISQEAGAAVLQEFHVANPGNWAFIWPTHLPESEWIAFFYLRHGEALQLQEKINQPLCFARAVGLLDSLTDPKWKALGQSLRALGMLSNPRCMVEPPFQWTPRLHLEGLVEPSPCTFFPILPVGDSLFYGHPHVGNGLGAHLAMINLLVKEVSGAL